MRIGMVLAVISIIAGCSRNDTTNTVPRPTASLEAEPDANTTLMDNDLTLVDGFLSKWDRLAQGENDLAPQIKQLTPEFEQALSRLLESRDSRAPARLVFYAVVQVGGYIEADSELGRAAKPTLDGDFNIVTNKDGVDTIFAGDLYHW
jgi:hypothetical protein